MLIASIIAIGSFYVDHLRIRIISAQERLVGVPNPLALGLPQASEAGNLSKGRVALQNRMIFWKGSRWQLTPTPTPQNSPYLWKSCACISYYMATMPPSDPSLIGENGDPL